jgi:hypothetical protein
MYNSQSVSSLLAVQSITLHMIVDLVTCHMDDCYDVSDIAPHRILYVCLFLLLSAHSETPHKVNVTITWPILKVANLERATGRKSLPFPFPVPFSENQAHFIDT